MTTEALLKRLRLTGDLPRYYWKAATEFGLHPAGAALLLLRTLREGYWPEESYRLGLLNARLAPRIQNAYCSKRQLVRLQRRVNPPSWEQFVANKAVFYRYCAQSGVPVPTLYAVFHRRNAGWTMSRPILRSDSEWEHFFLEECPPRFVVKPAVGHHGRGILVVERTGADFHLATGRHATVAELVRRLRTSRECDALVVQERLVNHPALRPMIAGAALTTSRIVTIVEHTGSVAIFSADLKIITGENTTSNFDSGATGNLIAQVSLKDGTIVRGLTVIPGRGYQEVAVHPETGATFAGFALPSWERVCSLVRTAALSFLPVRTIGWDVAHTPDGPAIIEGNFWYDPPNQCLRTGDLVALLTQNIRGITNGS